MTEQSQDAPGPERGPGGDGSAPDDEPEFEEAVSELDRVESRQRRLWIILGVVAVLGLGGVVILFAEYKSYFFQPKMPIEKSRRKIVRKTDDPQCRKLIADVTALGNRYFALESDIEKHVPGDDLEGIRNVDRKLVKLKGRLDDAEKLSEKANLRFEKSRKELDKWFTYVDNEIWVLRRVIDNQIASLTAERGADAGAGDGGAPRSSDVGSGGEGDAGWPGERADRSPRELRDSAMVALHDAFENFRVWHTANLHPCGDAAEDETPWRPDDWSADAGSGPDAGR